MDTLQSCRKMTVEKLAGRVMFIQPRMGDENSRRTDHFKIHLNWVFARCSHYHGQAKVSCLEDYPKKYGIKLWLSKEAD